MKLKVSREDMLDILYAAGNQVIEDLVIAHDRWTILYRLTFNYGDRTFQTTYRIGATEYQDEGPWDGEDEVECFEVVAVERMVTVYEHVEEG